jgi:hypothetical protein
MTWPKIFTLLMGVLEGDKYALTSWDILGTRKQNDMMRVFELYYTCIAPSCREKHGDDCQLCEVALGIKALIDEIDEELNELEMTQPKSDPVIKAANGSN